VTLVSELELPSFDYTDPQMRGARFHACMRAVREQGWLATTPLGYMVLDREACELFLRTRAAVFPGMKIAEIFGVAEGPLYEEMRRNILHINGPDHTRLRALVNPALAPRAVERYRPLARRLLEELWAEMLLRREGAAPGGPREGTQAWPARETAGSRAERSHDARCEFVEAFAKPYPSQMIAAVMGAPLSDAPRLHHWSNWIQRQFDAASMMSERELIEAAVVEFYEWCGELVRTRRSTPGDDLISKLIAATGEDDEWGGGGDGVPEGAQRSAKLERLSDVECVNLVLNVLIGGVDTTQSQLAHAVRLFAEHPAQWALLAEDPSLAAQAVEEVLRVEPITPFTARIVTEELTFRDVVFPKDTIVMVCAFTGNRDLDPPAEGAGGADAGSGSSAGSGSGSGGDRDGYANGDAFDITAPRGRARALTFGAGVHYCLGANLARMELQEALAFLAPRMAELELDGEPAYESITGIYGLAELPVRYSA
jgi:cytochrome P450